MALLSPEFVVFQDKAGEWRWRLRARNGRIIADSSESYKTWRRAQQALCRVVEIVKEIS